MKDQIVVPATALDALGHGVCGYSNDLMVTAWNSCLERLGVASHEARGRSLGELLVLLITDSDRRQEVVAACRAALADGACHTVPGVVMHFPAAPGSRFNLVATRAIHDADTGCLVWENVTETHRVRAQFERILNSTPDGIFVIDADRKIRLFNEACSFITGRHPEEILHEGCECSNVIHCHTADGESLATNLCPARDVFRGDSAHQREEMLLTNARGEDRWIETSYSAIAGPDGEVEMVVGVLRDVHERKQLEERLNQTEKLASLGQLVAGIAHEIKNPLAIINSSLDVMQNEKRPAAQRREAVGFVREEVQRIDTLLKSFLAFARPRPIQPRPTLISGLIRRRLAAMEVLFPEIQFQLELATSDPIVMADEEQLGQVLTNLVLNAGEAMDGRGCVVLRTRQHNGAAVMDVEDNGPGVPRELQARIFDPFFTTRAHGTGLGLSICYQLVSSHGGSISLTTARSGGACFTVRLPIAAHAAVG